MQTDTNQRLRFTASAYADGYRAGMRRGALNASAALIGFGLLLAMLIFSAI